MDNEDWSAQRVRREHSDTRFRAEALLAIGRDTAPRCGSRRCAPTTASCCTTSGGCPVDRRRRRVRAVPITPLDENLGRRAGSLLGKAGGSDVIDAVVVLLAGDDDLILTSDPEDLVVLAAASGIHVEIVPV